MNLVSNKTNNKVFLCLDSILEVDSKIDIILSPEFYWVRIFEIPLKNEKHALNVLPTLFEDLIDVDDDLNYSLKKLEENKYLCYAYSNNKIYEYLKKTATNLSLINSVYFAQEECKDQRVFSVDTKAFMYTEDNILVKVPSNFFQDIKPLDLESLSLKSSNVNIKLYNNSFNLNTLYTLVFVFLCFSVINFYKLFEYKDELSYLENKKIELLEVSKIPSSMIRANSIIKAYELRAQKEVRKRKALHYILSNKKFKLRNVNLDNDILDLTFENVDKRLLESYISKKYKIISSRVNALSLNIKVKL